MAAAAELTTLSAAIIAMLGGDQAVQAALAAAWPAPTGELAVLANVPHLLWQAQSAIMLAEHAAKVAETGTAFETLKAATPTPAEVELNQLTHGVLQATNFLGINTGAIVANRAQYFGDYWIRSASNKYAYGAASAAGVQSIEPLPPPVSIANPMGNNSDPTQASSAAQSPMQMLMPLVSQVGQIGGQMGQLAGGGGPLSSLMSPLQQMLQPLMSMSSTAGAVSDPVSGGAGSWVGAAPSVGGPVSASLAGGAAGIGGGFGGGGGGFGGAALAPLRGPVSWPSATVPVSAQPVTATAPASASAGTAPASIGGGGFGGGGAMMAPLAARAAGEDDQRDAEQSAAILGSIANFYREPVAVPVITGDAGALIGKGPPMAE